MCLLLILNNKKMNEIKDYLELDSIKDLFDIYKIGEQCVLEEKVYYIDCGSDRTAFGLIDMPVVIKLSNEMWFCYEEENFEPIIDFQGAIELEVYKQYKDRGALVEIYGASDDYCIIYEEEVETDWGACPYLKEFFDIKKKKITEVEIRDIIDDIAPGYFGFDFCDVSSWNVGWHCEDGVPSLVLLDFGYGVGESDEFLLNILKKLLKSSDKKINGVIGMRDKTLIEFLNGNEEAKNRCIE